MKKQSLLDNIQINWIDDRVIPISAAVGENNGEVAFSSGKDTMNHILDNTESTSGAITVPKLSVDHIAKEIQVMPEILKVDVEGYETEVVRGGMGVISSSEVNVLMMELRGHGSRYGFNENEIDFHMREFGFRSYAYDPTYRNLELKNSENGRLGDMLYIRDVEKARRRVTTAAKFKINSKFL